LTDTLQLQYYTHSDYKLCEYIILRKREEMPPTTQKPEGMLPLTPAVYAILLALADGERHGYSIMQEIAAQTGGTLRIGPTTLYRSIKRMLADGLIVEVDERPDPELDDERRRYYRLAPFGQQVAIAETRRLAQAVAVAKTKPLLGGSLPASSSEGAC
jgi:DNA-binding PadR family transcriptional regulator